MQANRTTLPPCYTAFAHLDPDAMARRRYAPDVRFHDKDFSPEGRDQVMTHNRPDPTEGNP